MKRSPGTQLGLFEEAAPAAQSHAVAAASVPPALAQIAEQLPPGIFLGTSSWHFPGWATLVYDRVADERLLAREGLAPYSQHPLLRCVGLDRTFYAPIPRSEYRHYAEQVPDWFRFLVKAPLTCTAPALRAEHGARGAANPHFLDPAHAAEHFVLPCLDGLGAKAGPLVFQFPPLPRGVAGHASAFAEQLHRFLSQLPRGPLYAVEIRDRELITDAYLGALHDVGARPCLSLHPRMPVAAEQARLMHAAQGGPLVVRWNLHEGFEYEEAKARYRPFVRLVDEDIPNRVALARLCLEAVGQGHCAYVVANNKAEGCAPLTLFKLAEQVVLARQHQSAQHD